MRTAPETPTAGPAPDAPRARRLRLIGILVLAAVVAGVAWFTLSGSRPARPPASVFEHVRDRILEGETAALWRVLSPAAREDYANFVRTIAGQEDPAAREWKARVGLPVRDLLALPPEQVMARQYAVYAEAKLRGARVYRTDEWSADEALIYILFRDGTEAHWVVRRVDGSWRVENLEAVITATGSYTRRPGETPRQVPIPNPVAPSPRPR